MTLPHAAGRLSTLTIKIGIGLSIVTLLFVTLRHKKTMWDFYSYYGAAMAVEQKIDPYRANLFNERYSDIGFSVGPHAYPPLTLLILRPLAFLPPVSAAVIWNLLKLIALLLTFIIVKRTFFDWSSVSYALPFFALAYNAAFFWDLATGNISLFEQLAIWLALACLLNNRPGAFTLLIVITAQLKLPPILFLGLLLLYHEKQKGKLFFLGCLGFAAMFSLNFILYPDYTRAFFTAVHNLSRESGIHSASTLIFIERLLTLPVSYGITCPAHLEIVLYLIVTSGIVAVSLAQLHSYKKTPNWDRVTLIFFFCVCYGILVPRFKSYQYAFLTFPTLFLIIKAPQFFAWPLVLSLAMYPHTETPLPGPLQKTLLLLYEYWPLLTLYLVWYGYLRYLLVTTKLPTAAPLSPQQPGLGIQK